jgi:hypothetical protein
MITLTRPVLLNLSLYAPLALAILASALLAILGQLDAMTRAAVGGIAYGVLWCVVATLFQPALTKWCSNDPE